MAKRIMAVVMIAVSALGWSVLTANQATAATGQTCTNSYYYYDDSAPLVVARVCMEWDDLGTPGGTYKVKAVRVWNPPGDYAAPVYAIVWWPDQQSRYTGGVVDGDTYVNRRVVVGSSTTRFEVAAKSTQTWCHHMVPRSVDTRPLDCW